MSWKIEAKNGVALVTMNSNKANVMNEQYFADFMEAMDRLEKDFPEHPVVITSEGKIFSAGLDFQYVFPLFAKQDLQAVEDWFERFRGVLLRFFTFPRPTIAAVNGHAFAGGIVLTLCCDFRLGVTGNARYSLNEVPIGVPMPSIFTEMIRYAIGDKNAAEMILLGNTYQAEEAKQIGVFHRVVEEDQLLDHALMLGQALAKSPNNGYACAKSNLQTPILKHIEVHSEKLDQITCRELISDPCRKAQEAAFAKLKTK